jgi:hypothetical protein
MLADQVYQILNSVSLGNKVSIDRALCQSLHEKGLVYYMPSSDYSRKMDELKELPLAIQAIEHLNGTMAKNKEALAKISEQQGSKLYKAASYFKKQADVLAEEGKKTALEEEIEKETTMLGKVTSEKDRLEALTKEMEGYSGANEGYLKITDLGRKKAKLLAARVERLGSSTYDAFENEITIVGKAIDERYQRFMKFYSYLVEQGFQKDNQVVQYALSLSCNEGTIEELYNRSGVINTYLYNNKWQSYERLRIVSMVSAQKGDIEKLKKHLEEIFLIMINDGHEKCYSTWAEAAGIMRIEGKSAAEKYRRFEDMRNALDARQWAKGKASTCYIAANLSQKKGDPENIAEEFRTLENKLVEKGRDDSVESGMAALVLLDGKGTLDERVDRFTLAFETMHKYGWKKERTYYAAAAIVSLMPGTVEENVLWLDEVTERLKADGYTHDITGRGLSIISGGFSQLLKQEVPSFGSSSHSSNYSSDHSSSGFNLSYGLLGDLADNGQIDLSGGFIAGGLIGGMFD